MQTEESPSLNARNYEILSFEIKPATIAKWNCPQFLVLNRETEMYENPLDSIYDKKRAICSLSEVLKMLSVGKLRIISVKRLTDNCIFTIGERVRCTALRHIEEGVIGKFVSKADDELFVSLHTFDSYIGLSLSSAIYKINQKETILV